jgi:hypothetical protein
MAGDATLEGKDVKTNASNRTTKGIDHDIKT